MDSKSKLERIILSTTDLGDVSGVDVSYTKDDCLTCFIYSDFIRLQNVEVYSGEQQKK